jgi:hypothetical protein
LGEQDRKDFGELAAIQTARHTESPKPKAGKAGPLCRRDKMEAKDRLPGRFLDVGSLRTFRSLHNFEFDHISFLQSAVAVSNDGGIVDEDIGAIVAPDEAVTFRVIEPFYGATQAWASLNKCFSFRLRPGAGASRPRPEIPRSLAERECQSIDDAVQATTQDEYFLRYKTI